MLIVDQNHRRLRVSSEKRRLFHRRRRVEQVGDGLAVLAVDAREQPAQVGASVFGLLGAGQASDEGLGERPQPLKEVGEDFGGNLALRQ